MTIKTSTLIKSLYRADTSRFAIAYHLIIAFIKKSRVIYIEKSRRYK